MGSGILFGKWTWYISICFISMVDDSPKFLDDGNMFTGNPDPIGDNMG